jgi:hypothetical protein
MCKKTQFICGSMPWKGSPQVPTGGFLRVWARKKTHYGPRRLLSKRVAGSDAEGIGNEVDIGKDV